jgi:hypothetical protein
MTWISCSICSPPTNKKVLVCTDCAQIYLDYFQDNQWQHHPREMRAGKITHWSPIPELPAEVLVKLESLNKEERPIVYIFKGEEDEKKIL